MVEDLIDAMPGLREVADFDAANPMLGFRPTPVQRAWLACAAPRFQLRGGNQLGKTAAQAIGLLERMLGPEHARWVPASVMHPPPIHAWMVCTSWKQSLTVMGKVHEYLPRHELAKTSRYSKRRGFTGQSFELRNGSMCTFLTVNQDDDELASATLHYIGVDEPPPESKWGELVARVRHHKGQIGLTYTPINRPVEYLREMVEKGRLLDIHAPLTLANVWPLGADRPFQTQEQIDAFADEVPPWQRAQRVDGAWEGATVDRWIADFDEALHMRIETPPAGAALAVGIDYGLRPGKMAVVLVAVVGGYTSTPTAWFVDEACAGADEVWDTEMLARKIKDMLARNRWDWRNIDAWINDRSLEGQGGSVVYEARKTRAALAALYGVNYSEFPRLEVPKKGENSVPMGCTVINSLFKRGRAVVHPRCARFRGFLNHFNGNPRDKVKDAGDAGRYAVCSLIRVETWSSFMARYS